ncbi:hypothetical protein VKT23_008454 [Stygiomarasmius scandens]|uniref:Alpha-amylase n=1 Tax=Marasmiellus scandens TaxID=2682957 RepID=A0ABR1JKQ9_9AGAR
MMRTLALSAFLAPALVLCASSDEWKSRSIYQVLTDRFAMADGSSPSCDTSERKYCGGTFQGITNKLDYIQGMGFDAIWISPVVENVDLDGTSNSLIGEAYHGYWTANINKINSHFGSADDLKSLSAALHNRGMYLMVDVVVNHLAAIPTNTSDVYPMTFDYSTLQPFGGQSSFHRQCFISDYDNQTDVEQCWLGTPTAPLIDLDTENSTNVDIMNNWVKNLVSDYGIDGLRIDTLKHVRKDFWPDFASSAGVYTVGEVFIGNTSYAAPYTEVISAVLDYPTYFAVFDAFTSTSGNVSQIAEMAQQAQNQYKDPFASGSFVENHDQPRIQSKTSDDALVKNAMTWPFINDGIPIIYQGQEQGYQGGADPANREALWLSDYVTGDKPLLTHVTTLNAARKVAISSNSNYLSTKATFYTQSSSNALAISKPPFLTLLTNGGSGDSSTEWNVPGDAGLFNGGETLVDVLSCDEVTVGSDGSVSAKASNGQPKVLMVKGMGEGVCHDNRNAAVRLGSSCLSFGMVIVMMGTVMAMMLF